MYTHTYISICKHRCVDDYVQRHVGADADTDVDVDKIHTWLMLCVELWFAMHVHCMRKRVHVLCMLHVCVCAHIPA